MSTNYRNLLFGWVLTTTRQWFSLCAGVLVGNKTDLDERRLISTKEGQQLAQSLSVEYFECSAVGGNMYEIDQLQ